MMKGPLCTFFFIKTPKRIPDINIVDQLKNMANTFTKKFTKVIFFYDCKFTIV